MTVDEAVAKIREAVVVHPGDTLIIRCADHVNLQELDDLAHKFNNRIPDVEVVIVAGGIDEIIVSRADLDPQAVKKALDELKRCGEF